MLDDRGLRAVELDQARLCCALKWYLIKSAGGAVHIKALQPTTSVKALPDSSSASTLT